MRATTAPVLKTDAPVVQKSNLRIHDDYPPVAMLGLYPCGNRMSIANTNKHSREMLNFASRGQNGLTIVRDALIIRDNSPGGGFDDVHDQRGFCHLHPVFFCVLLQAPRQRVAFHAMTRRSKPFNHPLPAFHGNRQRVFYSIQSQTEGRN